MYDNEQGVCEIPSWNIWTAAVRQRVGDAMTLYINIILRVVLQ